MKTHKMLIAMLVLMAFSLTISACGGGRANFAGGAGDTGDDAAEDTNGEPILGQRAQGDSANTGAEDMADEEMVEEAEESLDDAGDFAGAGVDVAGEPPVADEGQTESDQSGQPEDAPPPDAMFFEDYGDNPFVASASDNLSTFAVDTDTGSYTVSRGYLNDGYLPPASAVRVEEFVNFFDYDYPLPQQDDAFGIYLESAPTPFSVPENQVMRVGIQGFDVPADQRPDATLIFVIDVSGSMSGPERLGAVKVALKALTSELRATDKVGIVVYGSRGRVVLEPTAVEQGNVINQAIDSLQSEGSTNAEEGLRLAYELASEYYEEGNINRIILCSDGVANVGATGPAAILEIVKTQAREGITLTTVGFGMGNYNDVMMEQLADDGDGQYFYVDSQAEATRIFVHNLTGTLLTIARDAKVQVEFNPDVVSHYRLIGYENRDVADEDFRNDDVDAGEIGAGHSVTALYELVLTEQGQGDVATVYLRWEDPETGEVTELQETITTQDLRGSFDEASVSFKLAVAAAAFADVLGEGAWAQTVDLMTLFELAVSLADQLPNNTGLQEFPELIKEMMRLKGQ